MIFLVGLTAVVGSCEFGEIEIPEGDPMVVVHAVMRPDKDRQWVLVEQTLTGTAEVDDSGEPVIPGNAPHVPITNATVSVTNVSMPDDPCGDVLFTETPADGDLSRSLGLYWGPPNCPTMRSGDSLVLRVETADGSIVTGRAEVVGADRMVLRVNEDSVVVPGPSLVFNRDFDTLEAEVFPAAGRALQVEIAHPDSMNKLEPVFLMFVDSTAMTIPWDMLNFFDELFEDESTTSDNSPSSVFVAGKHHTVTVALMDDHFFDFERSANMDLSGRGFVNHLEGGMGVFGSIVAEANDLKVVGDIDDDREGGYRMVGTVQGVPVDIALELYVAAAEVDTTDMAAFVQGDWVLGDLDGSADGFFHGRDLALTIYQVDPADPGVVSAILIAGQTGSGSSFSLNAYDRRLTEVGTVSVTRN